MRINNQPSFNADSVANKTTRTDSAHTQAPAANAAPSSTSALSALAYSLVPSFELFSLEGVLTQIPAVRQDMVAQTVHRLVSGDLQSLTVLDQTANAILRK